MGETTKEYFRFQKVDDYFSSVSSWNMVKKATDCEWDGALNTQICPWFPSGLLWLRVQGRFGYGGQTLPG